MPPVACVPAIFVGCWGDLIVSGWKGSMQAPHEGSAHGMLLRIRQPRLLQDLSQRFNHILRGRNMKWSGEMAKNETQKNSPDAPSAPSVFYLDFLVPVTLIDAKQAFNDLPRAGFNPGVDVSHREIYIFLVVQELVPGICGQSRSDIAIHHGDAAVQELLRGQEWAWNGHRLRQAKP